MWLRIYILDTIDQNNNDLYKAFMSQAAII